MRERGFCSLCGALVKGNAAVVDGYVRCPAHAGLPSEQPRDERERLPTMERELRRELGSGPAPARTASGPAPADTAAPDGPDA